MAEPPERAPPRGRGAQLLEALRKSRESKPGGEPAETSQEAEPPKPRGRAALLQKLAEIKQSRVSQEPMTSPTSSTAVEAVEKRMSEVAISEPCTYQGSSGTKISAACNYIRLTTDSDKGIFEYRVEFNPPLDATSVRIKFIRTNLKEAKIFDGGAFLYLPKRLPQINTEYKCTNPNDNSEVIMSIIFLKQKRMSECLQWFNILFKNIMRELLLSPIGRNYFDPNHTHLIPAHKLEVLPGYVVAIDEYEGGVMVCCDTLHRVMGTQNVFDRLVELRCMCKDRFKEAAVQTLIGSVVLTRYNNRTYRIDEILWDTNPQNTFQTFDGRTISYIQYYKSQYNIDIQDHRQPLLLNMKSKKAPGGKTSEQLVCLIPELCYLTGLTDEMRSDFKVMKDIAMYTRVTPNQRMNALRIYIENIEKTPKAKTILSNWGLHIDNATIDLYARVLDSELILFGNGLKAQADKGGWSNAAGKNVVLGPVDLRSWVLFYTKRDEKIASNFVETTLRIAKGMGMRIDRPSMYLLKDDRTDTYVQTLKTVINAEIQILVFIFPTLREDRYTAIKRMCCSQLPISTQVIISRTLSNPNKVRAIIQKIALQINCKIGGTLWSLRIPVSNWMICGIDVFHSPGTKRSVCAFVSSINDNFTRWWSTTVLQEKELGDQIKMAFLKAIEKYREFNGVFPTNVIIFRDGVGDGALKQVLEYEIAQLEQILVQFKGPKVKLTVVIVQKRINTRLFLRLNGSDFDNPPPGTLVDHTVTKRNWHDFFLVAQHVRQGTVTPTHYIVLYDAANLKPDHLQKLTYKLCHLYYNWPGTIRVPAPCQYAHKLAYLIGQHVHSNPSPALCDKLFYL